MLRENMLTERQKQKPKSLTPSGIDPETTKKWNQYRNFNDFLYLVLITNRKSYYDTILRILVQRLSEWLIKTSSCVELLEQKKYANLVFRNSTTNDTTKSRLLAGENLQQNVCACYVMVFIKLQQMEQGNIICSYKRNVCSKHPLGRNMQLFSDIDEGDFHLFTKQLSQGLLFLAFTQAPQHLAVDQAGHDCRKPEKHDLENKEACGTTPQGLASEGAGGSGIDSRNSHQSGGEAQQQNSSTSNTTGNGNQSSNPSQSPSAGGDGGDEGRKPPNDNRTSPEKALHDGDGKDDKEEDGESDDQEAGEFVFSLNQSGYGNGDDQENFGHDDRGGEDKKVGTPTQVSQASTPAPQYRTVGQARRRRRKPKKHKLENKEACGTTLQNRRDQVECQEKTGISKQRKKGGFYRNNKSRDKRRKCQGEKSAARNEENCLRAKDSQQAVRRDQAYTRPVRPLRVKGVPLWKKKKVKGLRSNHEFKSWRQRAQSRCQDFPKNSLPVRMENRAADATPLKNQSTDGKSQTRKEELFGQAQERLNIGVDRLGNQHAACQTVDPDGYLDNQGNLANRSPQSLEQIAVLQKNPCDKVKVHQHVQLADGLGPTKELPAIKLPINLDSEINAARKDGRPTAKERVVDRGQSAKAVQNNDLDFAHQKNDDEFPGCVQVPRQAKSIQLIKPLPAEEDFNTQKTAQQNESFSENSWLKNRRKAWKGSHYRSKQQNLHSLLKPPEKATEPIDLGGNQVAVFCVVNPNNGNPSPQTLPTETPGGGGAGSVPRQSTTHDETGFGESQQTYDYHDNHIRDLHQVGEPPDIQLPPADAPQQPELPWPPPAIAGDDNENQLIVPRQVFDFEDENINFLQGVGEEVGVQEEDNVAELELHEMVQTDDFDDTDELYAP